MLRSAPCLFALALSFACAEPPPDAPAPTDDPAWEPFVHGDVTVGEEGQARFQIAPCAYAEMIDQLPSCALDMPFVEGHRTALHVEVPPGANGAFLSSDDGVLAIDDARPTSRSDVHRLDVTAVGAGDAVVSVYGDGGAIVDRTVIRVRRASGIALEVDDAVAEGVVDMSVGAELRLTAVPYDAEGEALNAWSEVAWSLDGDGVVRAVHERGAIIALVGEGAGDCSISVSVGSDAQTELGIAVR